MAVTRVQAATGYDFDDVTGTRVSATAPTLATAATAGNALLAIFSIDKNTGTITTPAGWTVLVNQPGASVTLCVLGKVAVGGETTGPTITWPTGQDGYTAIFLEYTGTTSTPFGPVHLPAYSDTARLSMTLGPLTATANSRAIAVFGNDSAQASGAIQDWNPTATGWTGAVLNKGASPYVTGVTGGTPGSAVVEMDTSMLSGAAVPATTFSWTAPSDQTSGALILLNAAAAPSPTAVTRSTSFELAPSGTVIPTTGSAGDGDPFDSGANQNSGNITSTNAVPAAIASGTLAAQVYSGTTTGVVYRAWDFPAKSVMHYRGYVYLTAYPSAVATIASYVDNTSGTAVGLSRLRIGSSGLVSATNGATNIVATTAAIPLNTLVRVEASWDFAAGTGSADFYTGSSTTPVAGGSISWSGQTYASTVATQFRGGSANAGPVEWTYYTDAWAISSEGRIGPVVVPAPGSLVQYPWVGGVTGTGAVVTTKTSAATSVRLKVGTNVGLTTGVFFTPPLAPDANGLIKHTISGLTANTQYFAQVEVDGVLNTAYPIKVKTFPTGQASIRIALGSCCNNAPNSSTFSAIAARNPDLFIHLGDFHYANITASDPALYRAQFDLALSAANQGGLYSTVPTAYVWDDHDYTGNNSNGGAANRASTQAAYRQQVPHYPLPAADAIYQTYSYGRVQFIHTDLRSYKTTQSATDDASKTMMGATQKQWFKDLITASTAELIIWCNSVPWIGPATVGEDSWMGYSTERAELAAHITASGKRVVIVSGDMHALAADDGTNSVGGIPVLQCGPLQNTASQKGGPYSAGVYPASGTALVQQYGLLDITDSGDQISVAFTGYSSDGTARVALTETYDLVTGQTITYRWDGTTLVRQREYRWDGTTLVEQVVVV